MAAGLFLGATALTPAHASTKLASGYLNEMTVFNHGYVTTKKAVKTTLYHQVNGKKVRYTIPKNTTLAVASVGYKESSGKLKTSVSIDLTNTSYAFKKSFSQFNASHGYWLKTSQLPLKTSIFKLAKTKNQFGGLTFERGTSVNNLSKATNTEMFTVTDNGYLQYYSSAKIKHADMVDGAWNLFISGVKPTNTRKITAVKPGKNVTYIYYNQPVNGLKEYKVKKGLYRLKINHPTGLNGHKTFGTGDQAIPLSWKSYYVGGQRYYVVNEM